MIDIKILRQTPEIVKNALKKRNIDISIEEVIELDTKLRQLKTTSQNISADRNRLAKEIGLLKNKGEDTTSLLEEVSKSKEAENELVNETKKLESKLEDYLSYIPNILSDDVPYGEDENSNIQVREVGIIKKFNFQPKDHADLGRNLQMIDFDKAASMAGSRFVILKDDIARLERAVANFMLDLHVGQHGYKEFSVPVILNTKSLFNTAQLPKFKDDLFKVDEDKWLISTTEIPLTNMFAEELIDAEKLPLRVTALSLCFRSESGAAGRDTKGMLRQHQFYKVELVSAVSPDSSYEELEYMTKCAEEVLKKLKIPYRVMLLCSGDTGFASAKTYDIEAWIPSQNTYREISSCSNCTDFQARRLNSRVKDTNGDKHSFIHTLNGSGLAVGRTIIAIMENYQQEDGSIVVPDVLVPYMNGLKIIKNRL